MFHRTPATIFLLVLLGIRLGLAQEAPVRTPISQQSADNRELEHAWNGMKQKDPSGWAQTVPESQKSLAKFGYGTLFTGKLDDRTKDAVRAYQNRNKLSPTGDLDYATWTQIQLDNAALVPEIPVGPMYVFNDSDWDSVLAHEGVWLEKGREPSDKTPLTSTRIECIKSNRTCIAATHRETLIHLQYLMIERWDKYEIETQPDDLPCGREHLHISRPEKAVLSINTAVYQNVEACTKLFGPPSKPVVSRLGDVRPLMHARLKAFREARDRILIIPVDAKTDRQSTKQ